jgi:gliding motility-associated-like protein
VEVYNFCRTVRDSARLIRVNPLPRFNILRNGDKDTTVCKNLDVSVFGPIGYEGYQWNVNDNGPSSGRQRKIDTDTLGRTKLFLKVTDEFGCSDSDTASITVIECTPIIYVPNAFSPQGDRQNDTWQIQKYNVSEIKVYVYNRWGEMVYFSDKKGDDQVQNDMGWDGKFKGGTCPSGAYKWLIDYKGTQDGVEIVRRDTGSVTIIR